jgi:hypothetical protein
MIADIESTIETLSIMRCQEENSYPKRDFLMSHQDVPSALEIDSRTRAQMVDWVFAVIDFCKFNREIAEITMNFLDRYMLTEMGSKALQDLSLFQLACVTSLYTAVKLHEPEALDPNTASVLSRGYYKAEQIEEMERNILSALQWRMNPPTAQSFVREMLRFIPADFLDEKQREMVLSISRVQVEKSIRDYDFITLKPSTIAFYSLANALNSLGYHDKAVSYLGFFLAEATGMTITYSETEEIQMALYDAVPGTHCNCDHAILDATNTTTKAKLQTMSAKTSPCSATHA